MPISKKFENYRLEMESLTDHSSKEYIEKKKKYFKIFNQKILTQIIVKKEIDMNI